MLDPIDFRKQNPFKWWNNWYAYVWKLRWCLNNPVTETFFCIYMQAKNALFSVVTILPEGQCLYINNAKVCKQTF